MIYNTIKSTITLISTTIQIHKKIGQNNMITIKQGQRKKKLTQINSAVKIFADIQTVNKMVSTLSEPSIKDKSFDVAFDSESKIKSEATNPTKFNDQVGQKVGKSVSKNSSSPIDNQHLNYESIDSIIKIGEILIYQGEKKKEKEIKYRPSVFKGNLLQQILFIHWLETQIEQETKDIWLPLTDFYYNYEQYIRDLDEAPISRHNHFEGLKNERNIEYDRKRNGNYIKGLRFKT